ncbi:NYN domain-containing protein [Sanguibacter sp. HDW7]|uniref:NYN domain-containing protein n=1 Tax=Sanguibacter sp. HDW7 TaxID=2714931 RepID=UPI00140C91F6|nr:NYN domain-containing protein [Sanguibacter sp. HDW7]QIK82646.1 NYN domain-containing protein [Sanguibacter sp. HDW7]
MGAKRVAVFFDWQNVYMRARESFHSAHGPAVEGQVDPVDLAHILLKKTGERNECEVALDAIHIYRGRPGQKQDERAFSAYRRQTSQWAQNRLVSLHARDLRYPYGWGTDACVDRPREKGVDVALAIDVVTMGRDEKYDIGIVMSADYDLVPALDYMVRRHEVDASRPTVEVAAWKGESDGRPLRIRLQGKPLWCHWLGSSDYWGAVDETDYALPADAPRRVGPPKPGMWLKR